MEFHVGNALHFRTSSKFQRVYVGGGVNESNILDLGKHLEDGGIMVLPCGSDFLKISKEKGSILRREVLSCVGFTPLGLPSAHERLLPQHRIDKSGDLQYASCGPYGPIFEAAAVNLH